MTELNRAEFAQVFQDFLESMTAEAGGGTDRLSALGERIQDHLGVPIREVDPIAEEFPDQFTIDVDRAITTLIERHDGSRIGVFGPHRDHVGSFLDMLLGRMFRFEPGPVNHVRKPIGPDTDRRIVGFGIALLRYDGVPLAALQQATSPRHGRDQYRVEVLAADQDVADRFLTEVRELITTDSVFSGQVLSFHRDHFDRFGSGSPLTFLRRPAVPTDEVILPAGVLDRIVGHVVGIGREAGPLAEAGHHLKRGVLLYGPPGTGKTHVVRHLLTITPGTTAVLLSGQTLEQISVATRLARSSQPAIIVLEDCDLVAEHRGGDSNAALFETLEALDGIAGDADIAFVMTTNRPDLLERALVERPGRVDLAVKIDKPGTDDRLRLLRLYGARHDFSDAALAEAAERTDGATASFAKELVRRAALRAEGTVAQDQHLTAALADLLSDTEKLTRTLLGHG
ncbi:ATP-binding protein [Microlunatus speluncae]|uniref:ATP-binding protein n=1 Tax=Microlunatus speluncae TaxID=2594267 RepID=UPI00126606E8|nr:ATP-binding protein [Microlunatus speluncae]